MRINEENERKRPVPIQIDILLANERFFFVFHSSIIVHIIGGSFLPFSCRNLLLRKAEKEEEKRARGRILQKLEEDKVLTAFFSQFSIFIEIFSWISLVPVINVKVIFNLLHSMLTQYVHNSGRKKKTAAIATPRSCSCKTRTFDAGKAIAAQRSHSCKTCSFCAGN